MKRIKLWMVAVSGLWYIQAGGQGAVYSLKGNVADSAAGTPIEHVVVTLKRDTLLTGLKTNTAGNGDFYFEKLSTGDYAIYIEAATYQRRTLRIAVHDSSPRELNIGTVFLARKVHQLGEVKVMAGKQLVRHEIDRIIYNVADDPDSKALNMLDMMRKVPLISVTAEDMILFKGSSGFRVLLDGRASPVFSSKNLRDILKGIPASSIQRIEVITVPPARYEAEGITGLINIVTQKKLKDGYNGSANANYSNLFSGISASFNLRKGKFGASGFNGYSHERLPASPVNVFLSQHSPVIFRLYQSGSRKYYNDQGYGSYFLSFEADSLNLITADAGWRIAGAHNRNNQATTIVDNTEQPVQSYALRLRDNNNDFAWNAGLNYQKGFKQNKSRFFTVSYRYWSGDSRFRNESEVDQKMNYLLPGYRQKNTSGGDEHYAQADYISTIKELTIEAGSKYSYRDKFSHFFHDNYDSIAGAYKPDENRSDAFAYRQQILGFYNSCQLKIKNWAVKAGVRLEKTTMDVRFRTGNNRVSQHYTNLLPSFVVLWKSKKAQSVNLGYSRRIQRPGVLHLNPFVDLSDPKFQRSGNPGLLPVFNHNFSFNFSRIKKSTMVAGITYSFSKNGIQSVATSLAQDSVIRATYLNIGKYDNVGANLNLSFIISPSVTITGNGTISYVWVKAGQDHTNAKNRGIEGFVYSYISCRAKKNWRFSANAGFYGPARNLQGNTNEYFYSSFSVSKQLFKRKGGLALSVSNPFQERRKAKTIIRTSYFYQENSNNNVFRNVNVSFYYSFGKLKDEVKRNRRTISNDDKVTELGKPK